MYPLISLFGPFSVQAYGLAILCGVLIAIYLALKNPRLTNLMDTDQFLSFVSWAVLVGVASGHFVHVITQPFDWYTLLNPLSGFSILGTVLGLLLFIVIYLPYQQIAILPFLDVLAIYTPLAQGFGRIGCFFAGCCHGIPTTLAWAITYTNSFSAAPCNIPLHPTQLYSAALLFGIFGIQIFLQRIFVKPGQLTGSYLLLMSIERFSTDFLRADHSLKEAHWFTTLSIFQWLSFGIGLGAIILFLYSSYRIR